MSGGKAQVEGCGYSAGGSGSTRNQGIEWVYTREYKYSWARSGPYLYSTSMHLMSTHQVHSQVYKYLILASISIYLQVISMILMSIISLYRYFDLKYMIYAIYVIGLGR